MTMEQAIASTIPGNPVRVALEQMRAAYAPLHDRVSPIVEGDVVWSEAERAALADMLETCCEADAAAERVLEGHDAPDAAPAAPQTPEPDWRAIAGSLVGLAAARAEEMESAVGEGGDAWSQEEADEAWSAVEAARAAFAGSPAPQTPDASALMLEALRLAAERIEMNNYGGEEDEHLAVIHAAIATGEA